MHCVRSVCVVVALGYSIPHAAVSGLSMSPYLTLFGRKIYTGKRKRSNSVTLIVLLELPRNMAKSTQETRQQKHIVTDLRYLSPCLASTDPLYTCIFCPESYKICLFFFCERITTSNTQVIKLLFRVGNTLQQLRLSAIYIGQQTDADDLELPETSFCCF
ncbi:unnamed protein product [Ixodes pacificus]